MKIRIKKNLLILRIYKKDLEIVRDQKEHEIVLGDYFRFSMVFDSKSFSIEYYPFEILIRIPEEGCKDWLISKEMELRYSQEKVEVVLQKDLKEFK